jgi:hypothetical protein
MDHGYLTFEGMIVRSPRIHEEDAMTLPVALIALLGLTLPPPPAPDEGHSHGNEKLGRVDFPVTCAPAARAPFTRAVALLHSFAYAEARAAFEQVAKADVRCAMAHWGVAMTLFHPVWAAANPTAAPTADELQRGSAAVEKAKALGGGDAREKDYIGAVDAFYAGSGDYAARALAFETAMEGVHRRHPKDREAAIFYGLALLGNAPPTDKTYARQKKAAAILNAVLPEAPEHPGVAHYIIHSFDYPPIASLALPAARAYSKIAPSAPHALHMPSHIFTRLALWDDSIQSNLASAATAREWVARTQPGATSFDELHALDYLEYAYLQTCRAGKAAGVLDTASRVERVDEAQFAAAYALAAIPVRHAVERRDWRAAQAVALKPASFPWDRFLNTQALVEFAHALGAARGGAPDQARPAYDRLAALQKALVERKDAYWAGQVEVQRLAAGAWIAQAEGRPQEALSMMRSAAEAEDASEKHPVTPGHVLPAREQLGDLLLEQGQPAEALAAYEASLRTAPGRYNSLRGAQSAAAKAGDTARARRYAGEVTALCARADGSWPGLDEAKAALRGAP